MKATKQSRRFAKVLRQAHHETGLSQKALARLLRIEQGHLSKLERGERLPSWHTLRRLARVFPTDVERMLLL